MRGGEREKEGEEGERERKEEREVRRLTGERVSGRRRPAPARTGATWRLAAARSAPGSGAAKRLGLGRDAREAALRLFLVVRRTAPLAVVRRERRKERREKERGKRRGRWRRRMGEQGRQRRTPVLLFFFPDLQGRKHRVRECTSAGGGVRGASSSSSTPRWSRHASVQHSRPQEKFKLIRRCYCFRPPRTRAGSRVRKQPVRPRHGAVGLLRRAATPAPTEAPRRLLQHRVQLRW